MLTLVPHSDLGRIYPKLPAIIPHVVNDRGGFGRGFAAMVARRYPAAAECYRLWAAGTYRTPFQLGLVQFVPIGTNGLWIANMLAQRGYATAQQPQAIDYDALAECLGRLAIFATRTGASIHMPRIGCGLAGGTWSAVEPLILQSCGHLPVYVYTL